MIHVVSFVIFQKILLVKVLIFFIKFRARCLLGLVFVLVPLCIWRVGPWFLSILWSWLGIGFKIFLSLLVLWENCFRKIFSRMKFRSCIVHIVFLYDLVGFSCFGLYSLKFDYRFFKVLELFYLLLGFLIMYYFGFIVEFVLTVEIIQEIFIIWGPGYGFIGIGGLVLL